MTSNAKPQDDTVLARLNDPSAQVGVDERGPDPRDPHQTDDDDTVLAHLNGPAEAGDPDNVERDPDDVERDDDEPPATNGSE